MNGEKMEQYNEKLKPILNDLENPKIEIAGGYLNFFVNKDAKIKTVLEEISSSFVGKLPELIKSTKV